MVLCYSSDFQFGVYLVANMCSSSVIIVWIACQILRRKLIIQPRVMHRARIAYTL